MSDPIGTYAFLPWVQRGLATEIGRVDGEPSADAHVDIPVSITFNSNLATGTTLTLVGPGDVGGLDPSVISRIYPIAESYDAETNYFPLIEFEQPDLPWRYTPARATPGDRLRPWICLIVLRDEEIEAFTETGADGAMPVVTVASAAALPLLAQSWAWAHVQIAGVGTQPIDAATLRSVLTGSPDTVVARLLSSRRLDPNTCYTAFLVPSFEVGRLAGLGQPVTGDSMAPAWNPGDVSVRLPVYYRWRFGTSAAGDFEHFARQLQARPLPPEVGHRPIDVSAPGAGLPLAADIPLPLEGALVGPTFTSASWVGAVADAFRTELAALINRPADLLAEPGATRVVAPPLYGRWHAVRERLLLAATALPRWFHELSVDPRWRVAAGLGTQVVQAQERQLMASAWQQVEGIREANERLRLTQIARASAVRIYERHIAVADAEGVLGVTAPLHAKVLASPITIASRLTASPVPTGVLDPQFRRVGRPRGPVGRRLGIVRQGASPTLVGKLNSGKLVAAPEPPRPDGIVTRASAAPLSLPSWATSGRLNWLRQLARLLPLIALVLVSVAVLLLFAAGAVTLFAVLAGVSVLAAVASELMRRAVGAVDRVRALGNGTLAPRDVEQAPSPRNWRPSERPPSGAADAGASVDAGTPPPGTPSTGASSRPSEPIVGGEPRSVHAFRTAAAELLAVTTAPVDEPAILAGVSMTGLRGQLLLQLHPKTTVAAGVRERLRVPGGVRQPTEDPLELVMAAPEFPQPMYLPLAELSQDWLLPGLDKVPQNTTTLLKTNQRFIESYMVGLNHEMARELQWNEYPTDMRGSYFRQFWDTTGYVPPDDAPIDAEALRDIKKIDTWDGPASLGANTARRPPPGGEHLVLLVRGELLRRYPNTMVYAVRTVRRVGVRELGDEERHPVFSGRLYPDVTFFGFELTVADVRGVEDAAAENQGWYFVLQEQPTEPRFGLDVAGPVLGATPSKWSELSWGHLASTDAALAALSCIDLNADLPDTRSVTDATTVKWHADAGQGAVGSRASDLAYITLQQPMRVAIHGSDMVLAP